MRRRSAEEDTILDAEGLARMHCAGEIGRTYTYTMRDVPGTLWQAAKARAATEGHGQRWVILRLLELYAQVGIQALEKAAKS